MLTIAIIVLVVVVLLVWLVDQLLLTQPENRIVKVVIILFGLLYLANRAGLL